MKAIINGNVVLEDCVVENCAVFYNEVIEGIFPMDSLPELTDVEVIDAKGGFITPGFIDLHIHGYLGADVCDADPAGIEKMAKGLIANGVTGFLPTTMTVSMDTIKASLNVCRDLREKSHSWDGSVILGVHAAGPFINIEKKGAQDPAHILKPDAEFIKEYSDIIKIITVAPEEDVPDFAVIRECVRDTDVVFSIGHTGADYKTAMAGFEAGVSHVTHLFNAMSPLSHREPGVVTAALNSSASCELIVDTFHVDPSLYEMVYRMKGDKLCFITDCLPAGGLPVGEYTLGGRKIIFHGDLCRLEDGTISGSALKLNEGVRNVYKHTDIPLWECVNCASRNPARVLGLGDTKGTIELGKDADLVVTDPDFNVTHTVIAGNLKFKA